MWKLEVSRGVVMKCVKMCVEMRKMQPGGFAPDSMWVNYQMTKTMYPFPFVLSEH